MRRAKEADLARKALERASTTPSKQTGRPLKGAENRIVVSNRWEPTMLIELHKLTGCSTGELVERLHSMLKLVSEYRQAKDAALHAVESLLAPSLDKAS